MFVHNIKENKDGSITIEASFTKNEQEKIKTIYKRKRFTSKLAETVINEAIRNGIERLKLNK